MTEAAKPPTATEDSTCGQCGAKPVAFAVGRTGGIFTPPPFIAWMFMCAPCEAELRERHGEDHDRGR